MAAGPVRLSPQTVAGSCPPARAPVLGPLTAITAPGHTLPNHRIHLARPASARHPPARAAGVARRLAAAVVGQPRRRWRTRRWSYDRAADLPGPQPARARGLDHGTHPDPGIDLRRTRRPRAVDAVRRPLRRRRHPAADLRD